MRNICLGSKLNKRAILYAGIAMVTVLLNALAWSSTAFCDAYIIYVFPIWVNFYGRLTGLFPFSVGEWMILAGVLLCVMAVCLMPFLFVKKFRKGCKKFYVFFAWVLLIVCLVMTLNCFILYHATPFSETYFGENVPYRTSEDTFGEKTENTAEVAAKELLAVRNLVVEECNLLSAQVERDEKGAVIYPGGTLADGTGVDMEDKARETMKQLGKTYARLDGWYPRPKAMLASDFMCQQYMQGYFFPFSMEANYNDVMELMNKPATMCHELAHLRGYILEDEANFISFLACTGSDDIYFQYSGYLSVLNYLENDLYRIYSNCPDAFWEAAQTNPLIPVLDVVVQDNVFVSDEEWERINKTALIDTEVVDAAADVYVDVTLKVNGVSDGMISYSRVVELLLLYYSNEN